MNPSPETCKRLTSYLGECRHEGKTHSLFNPLTGSLTFYCDKCGVLGIFNRPFTTPADLFAVYSKIVERGEWEAFQRKMYIKYPLRAIDGSFGAWLFCLNTPDQIGERMEMAGAWLKEVKL